MIRTLDLRLNGHKFSLHPPHVGLQPWASCSHLRVSCYQAV